MEEDIKILEELFKDFKEDERVIFSQKGLRKEKEFKAIENLIKGYRELEEWKREKGCSIQEVYELFIPKSKIKEKLDKQYELWNTPNKQKEYSQEVVDVLQELMEDK